MKLIFKSILIFIVFLISLMIFIPKEGFYNLLEKELAKQNLIISNELRNEKFSGLEIKGAEIYFDGINTAFIKQIDISTFLFFNSINIDTIRVSKDFEKMLPQKINNIDIEYSILDFKKVKITASGDFGTFDGNLFIFDKKIQGELKPSAIMKSKYRDILRNFKLVKGKYKYEFKF